MPKNDSAIVLDSLNNKSDELDPSPEGKKAQKTSDQLISEYQAENKRKAQEIAELKASTQAMQEKFTERLDELENKTRLTKSEVSEKEELETIVSQLAADKRSTAWRTLGKRDADEVFKENLKNEDVLKSIIHSVDYEYAMDRTEELAEKEGLDSEEFQKLMLPYLKRFSGKPTTILKKAYAAYEEDKATKEKLKKLDSIDRRELGGRAPQSGKKETIEEAKKSGNFTSILKSVADLQERRSSGIRE